MRIEWPKGSGVVAEYEPHEQRMIRALIDSGRHPDADRDAIASEVEFLHALKATFRGTFLS